MNYIQIRDTLINLETIGDISIRISDEEQWYRITFNQNIAFMFYGDQELRNGKYGKLYSKECFNEIINLINLKTKCNLENTK